MQLSRAEIEALCARNLLANPFERVYFKDLESRFLFVSPGYLSTTARGYTLEELIGKTDFDLFSDEHASAAFHDEQMIISTGESLVAKVELESFADRPDSWVSTTKLPLRDKMGRIVGTFGISRDVSAQVEAERALAHQAFHDSATGLANRAALMDRLERAIVALERRPARIALFFVDLDNFKVINDTLGHNAGDRVLLEIGRRLSGTVRRGDTVARLGGDEFVLLCGPLREDDDVRLMADRALRAIGEKHVDAGLDLTVTGSIGAVVSDDPLADPEVLLQQCDLAMYEAKAAGKNRFRVFDNQFSAHLAEGREFGTALRKALAADQLFLVYQPLFTLDDRALRGVEALVRWRHPERGVILPCDFILAAEDCGLIGAIDSYVLDEACRQLAQWTRDGELPAEATMAVNVSGRQLSDPTLVHRVSTTLQRHGIEPSRLCMEITETALIGELTDVEETLAELSRMGVRLALDDFGTGYSTLAHIQRLKVDVLKIDRSFIEQMSRSQRDHEIVGAVTAMAHALGMSVVGEGIETTSQLGDLSELGCDVGQGYLLARPLPPDQVASVYAATESARAAGSS